MNWSCDVLRTEKIEDRRVERMPPVDPVGIFVADEVKRAWDEGSLLCMV